MKKLVYLLIGLTAITAVRCSADSAVSWPTDPTNPPTVVDPIDPPVTPPTNPNPGEYVIPVDLQGYYASIDFRQSGVVLKKQLADLVTNTQIRKLSYSPDVWGAIKATDYVPVTSGKPTQVYLIYGHPDKEASAEQQAYIRDMSKQNAGGNGYDTWNREHVYTQDAGGFNIKVPGASTDAHNLRSADVGWNGRRANLKFIQGSGNSGLVSNGWYPGDTWKGDVARMMMYMYIRYGEQCSPSNIGYGSSTATPDNMIDLFLQWNAEDPVSDMERIRNTYHAQKNNQFAQGNRNPFIDNPDLANKIWGGPKAENKWSK